jgi:3',5'-nucleoside bisphosphate phosphatase
MKTADLHVHTTASDGRVSPQEILVQAQAAGLTAISITDHDTVDGLLSVTKTLEQTSGLEVIPGIEFSTDLPGHEVHILGYFIDPFHSELRLQLKYLIDDRIARVRKIVDKLEKLGYFIEYDRVVQLAGTSTAIGRPHIARALVEKKYFSCVSDVFQDLLKTDGPAYVPHYKLDPQSVIKLIRLAGGLPILAHPRLIQSDEIVKKILSYGIVGIEAYHPIHEPDAVKHYLAMAKEYHLCVTGGSDYHAIPERFPEQLGIYMIDYELVKKLRQRASNG